MMVGDPVNLLPDTGDCPMCGETLDTFWEAGDPGPRWKVCTSGCGASYAWVMTIDGTMLQPIRPTPHDVP